MRSGNRLVTAALATLTTLSVGCGGRSSDALVDLAGRGPVYGVPNIDDDDLDGVADFRDLDVDGENDLAPIDLSDIADGMRGRDRLELVLVGNEDVRIWDGDQLLLDEDIEVVEFRREEVPDGVQVEFLEFADRAELVVTHRKPPRTLLVVPRGESRSVVEQVRVELRSSPLILSHHLQPTETSYVVEGVQDLTYTYYGYLYSFDNVAMVDAMDRSLRDGLVVDDVFAYNGDVWVQDEFETATAMAPGVRLDVIIDSIRDRGLDDFPERVVAGDRPDRAVRTWGRGNATSQDSFGNLEVSPPVTVDGVDYPFGRIYWGRWEGEGLVPSLARVLEGQGVQDPFTLDVSFLSVGHVDEFTTFLPDSTSDKGFRLFVTDTDLGMAFLDSLPADTPLDPRYDRDHGFATVAEMRESVVLRALNEDYQRDYIEPAIDVMKAELGLTDDDIVRVPGLFEESYGPYAGALIPGTVNMLVHTATDGTARAFVADPFLRAEGQGLDADPFVAEIEALLPADVELVWVDNWDVYHIALGEVHCGTNALRTPTANWWEVALHLLPDGDE